MYNCASTDLVANSADVVVPLELLLRCVWQAVDFGGGSSAVHEGLPTGFGLQPTGREQGSIKRIKRAVKSGDGSPYVTISVDQHHDGPDGAPGLEDEDPTPVEEEEHSEAELHGAARRLHVVDGVIK